MEQRILVTGGAGFVGSALCAALVGQANTKVISLDNYFTGVKDNHVEGVEYIDGSIIGPSELGYQKQLERLVARLSVARVRFEGPVYGDRKRKEYSDADIFVLPTLHENFGLVVAEALAAGVPVITTHGAPWGGLEANGCGWWIDHGVESLAKALRDSMQLDDLTRETMGKRGRAWMVRDYSWDSIASNMHCLHEWCLGSNNRPDFVVG